MEFTLHTKDRGWVFQCESAEKCKIWCDHIGKYIGEAGAGGGGVADSSSPTVRIDTTEDTDLGDDSDADD